MCPLDPERLVAIAVLAGFFGLLIVAIFVLAGLSGLLIGAAARVAWSALTWLGERCEEWGDHGTH